MSPYQHAAVLCGEDLPKIVDYCMRFGIVHSDGELFLCAYKTNSSFICDETKKTLDKPDTWYVYMLAGDISKAFQYSKDMKYVAYQRFDGSIRLLELDRVRRLYGKLI